MDDAQVTALQVLAGLDWTAIGAAVVAVLALVASVFSAVGAARAADTAGKAEARIVAAERDRAVRELNRSLAQIEVEAQLAQGLAEGCIRVRRELAIRAGAVGGSGEAVDRRRYEAALASLASLKEATFLPGQIDVADDEDLAARQCTADESLIRVRGIREELSQEVAELRRQTEVLALAPQPGWGGR